MTKHDSYLGDKTSEKKTENVTKDMTLLTRRYNFRDRKTSENVKKKTSNHQI